MSDLVRLQVASLGAQGDGVVPGPDGPVYVPFALPGESVLVEVTGERGRLVAVERPSPDRVAAQCRHFTSCGGCRMQHLARPAYEAWKRELVLQAFAARGIADPRLGELITVASGERRRAALSARRTAGGVVLGFHEECGTAIVDLAECPVTSPAIVAALPGLRRLLEPVLPHSGEARVRVTVATQGLDVTIEGLPEKLSAPHRAGLARAAQELRLVRLASGGDLIFAVARPTVRLGGVEVAIPDGAFLQAAQSAEQAMATRVVAAVGKARRIADLYCGCGTFTFALAGRAPVLAVDSSPDAIAALAEAARHAKGLKRIETRVRDLARDPLSRKELEGFDAVVVDPPRAGARAQAEALGRSGVAKVVLISCNAATLARDARILLNAGYELQSVIPVDQFLFSPHVEIISVLHRM